MEFVYTTKHVGTVEEYLAALSEGCVRVVIDQAQEKAVFETLAARKDEHLAYKWMYAVMLVRSGAISSEYEGTDILKELVEKEHYLPAQNTYGFCYFGCLGRCTINMDRDFWYFECAAKAGFAPAQNNLARLEQNTGIRFGSGFNPDQESQLQCAEAAWEWMEKAAAQGLAVSQYNMGLWYHYGLGARKDAEAARMWYEKALTQGHARAEKRLAELAAGETTLTGDKEPYAIIAF